MKREILIERFFTSLISGDRSEARAVLDNVIATDCSPNKILSHLFWPTLEQIQKLHRSDQLSDLAHHYAIRLLRMLTDQMQLRLEAGQRRGTTVLVICGPDEPEELAAQMAADLLEADGYHVFLGGGGIAKDELVAEIGRIQTDILVVFGSVPSTIPFTRLLIDRLHKIGACPKLQVAVGGGVFNRADGLAEEIGADIWAKDPVDLVHIMAENPHRRMSQDQRTVGQKRRGRRTAAA